TEATIEDLPIIVQGQNVTATEGASFNGTLGSITDLDQSDAATQYNISINWGDGATSAGTAQLVSPGMFSVHGTHTYAEEGSHSISLSVTDNGGSSGTASSTA